MKLPEGITPTGYQWWLSINEDASGAWAEPGCTSDSYIPPSRYIDSAFPVWQAQRVVTYDGGTATTQWVKYNKNEYPIEKPVGWDTQYWYGTATTQAMPNQENSNPVRRTITGVLTELEQFYRALGFLLSFLACTGGIMKIPAVNDKVCFI